MRALKEVTAYGEAMYEQVLGKRCGPCRGIHMKQVFWQELWSMDPYWSSVSEGSYSVESTHGGAVPEELQPVGRTHDGTVHEGLSLMGGTSHQSRGEL